MCIALYSKRWDGVEGVWLSRVRACMLCCNILCCAQTWCDIALLPLSLRTMGCAPPKKYVVVKVTVRDGVESRRVINSPQFATCNIAAKWLWKLAEKDNLDGYTELAVKRQISRFTNVEPASNFPFGCDWVQDAATCAVTKKHGKCACINHVLSWRISVVVWALGPLHDEGSLTPLWPGIWFFKQVCTSHFCTLWMIISDVVHANMVLVSLSANMLFNVTVVTRLLRL